MAGLAGGGTTYLLAGVWKRTTQSTGLSPWPPPKQPCTPQRYQHQCDTTFYKDFLEQASLTSLQTCQQKWPVSSGIQSPLSGVRWDGVLMPTPTSPQQTRMEADATTAKDSSCCREPAAGPGKPRFNLSTGNKHKDKQKRIKSLP